MSSLRLAMKLLMDEVNHPKGSTFAGSSSSSSSSSTLSSSHSFSSTSARGSNQGGETPKERARSNSDAVDSKKGISRRSSEKLSTKDVASPKRRADTDTKSTVDDIKEKVDTETPNTDISSNGIQELKQSQPTFRLSKR